MDEILARLFEIEGERKYKGNLEETCDARVEHNLFFSQIARITQIFMLPNCNLSLLQEPRKAQIREIREICERIKIYLKFTCNLLSISPALFTFTSLPLRNKPLQQERQKIRESIEFTIKSNILIPQLDSIFHIWIFILLQ